MHRLRGLSGGGRLLLALAVGAWRVVESPAMGNKAAWIRDAFRVLGSGRFPRVKAISWWHEKWQESDGHWDSTMIDGDPAVLRAYRQGIAGAGFLTRPVFGCAGR